MTGILGIVGKNRNLGFWQKCLYILFFVVITLSAFYRYADATNTPSGVCPAPPFISSKVPPLLMLVVSKDHKSSYKAYDDYSDLLGDGTYETQYVHTITYTGYFDPNMCYIYDGTNNYFYPDINPMSAGVRGSCGGEWSGNFLNWASMSRMDIMRYVLYGGYREVDNNDPAAGTNKGSTILRRQFLPQDAHSWVKVYTPGAGDEAISDLTPIAGVTITPTCNGTLSCSGSTPQCTATTTPTCSSGTASCSGTTPVCSAAAPTCSHGSPSCPDSANAHCVGSAPTCVSGVVTCSSTNYTARCSGTASSPTCSGGSPTCSAGTAYCDRNSTTPTCNTGGTLACSGTAAVCNAASPTCSSGAPSCPVSGGAAQCSGTVTTPTCGSGTLSCSGGTPTCTAALPGISICNTTSASDADTNAQAYNEPPLMRVASGAWPRWSSTERWQCIRDQEHGTGTDPNRAPAATGLFTDYSVRVAVCMKNSSGNPLYTSNQNCKTYPNGNVKPIGILQEYGDNNDMYFGLLTGSWTKNMSGGVLRKNIGTINDEIDYNPTAQTGSGRFFSSPGSNAFNASTTANTFASPTSGIIGTLNLIQVYRYDYKIGTSWEGTYNTSDSCIWGTTLSGLSNGMCTNWGNPLSEMYYETVRYFTGKAAPSTAYDTDDHTFDTKLTGLTKVTWKDPFVNINGNVPPYCSKPFVMMISDTSPSFDADELPGTSFATYTGDITGLNVTTETDKVGVGEYINGNNYFMGETGATGTPGTGLWDDICDPKQVATLSTTRGLCPVASALQGSYYVAGLAEWSHLTDLRSPALSNNLSNDSTNAVKQNITTYSIALAPPLPTMKINVNGTYITMVPTCANKTTNTNCSLVQFRIAQTPWTSNSSTGLFYINWEDSMQGGDYDMDSDLYLAYCVGAACNPAIANNQIKFTIGYLGVSSGYRLDAGIIVSGTGTNADGIYYLAQNCYDSTDTLLPNVNGGLHHITTASVPWSATAPHACTSACTGASGNCTGGATWGTDEATIETYTCCGSLGSKTLTVAATSTTPSCSNGTTVTCNNSDVAVCGKTYTGTAPTCTNSATLVATCSGTPACNNTTSYSGSFTCTGGGTPSCTVAGNTGTPECISTLTNSACTTGGVSCPTSNGTPQCGSTPTSSTTCPTNYGTPTCNGANLQCSALASSVTSSGCPTNYGTPTCSGLNLQCSALASSVTSCTTGSSCVGSSIKCTTSGTVSPACGSTLTCSGTSVKCGATTKATCSAGYTAGSCTTSAYTCTANSSTAIICSNGGTAGCSNSTTPSCTAVSPATTTVNTTCSNGGGAHCSGGTPSCTAITPTTTAVTTTCSSGTAQCSGGTPTCATSPSCSGSLSCSGTTPQCTTSGNATCSTGSPACNDTSIACLITNTNTPSCTTGSPDCNGAVNACSITPNPTCNNGGNPTCQAGVPVCEAAAFLHDPLWYAAKWGAFQDSNNSSTPDLATEWSTITAGTPDTYFYVSNPTQLQSALETSLTSIIKRVSSGTSATVLPDKSQFRENVIQVAFYPTKDFSTTQNLKWIGYVNNLWFYNKTTSGTTTTNIREDTVHDDILNLSNDNIIEFCYNSSIAPNASCPTANGLTVQHWQDNGSGGKGTQLTPDLTLDTMADVWESGINLFGTTPGTSSANGRTIYVNGTGETYPKSSSSGTLQEFTTANESSFATNASTISASDHGHWMGAYTTTGGINYLTVGSSSVSIDNVVNYIRGTDITGLKSRTATVSGSTSTWKLGDIIYSTPALVSYASTTMVYVGANDGMLHAFKLGLPTNSGLSGTQQVQLTGSNLGNEMWAFIPRHSLPYLRNLADPAACHLYYVDLHPYTFNPASDTTKTILIGGMRLGAACGCTTNSTCTDTNFILPPSDTCFSNSATDGSCIGLSSYFALDVTDPTNPSLLWEWSHPDLGFSMSGPSVITRSGTTMIMFLNGPQTYSGLSFQSLKIFVLTLNSDMTIHTVNEISSTNSNLTAATDTYSYGGRLFNNGIDVDGDGNTDYVAFGRAGSTASGSLTAFKGGIVTVYTGGTDPTNVCNTNCAAGTFGKTGANCWSYNDQFVNDGRPITASVIYQSCFNSKFLYAGSGKYFTPTDTYDTATHDRLYGIPFPCDATGCCQQGNFTIGTNASAATMCTNFGSTATQNAWHIDLDLSDTINGVSYLKERSISDPSPTSQGFIFFSTTEPTSDVCAFGGQSRVWAINCAMGGSVTQTDCGATTIANLSGTLLLQLSTSAVSELNAGTSFTQNGGLTTGWMQGITPDSPPPFIPATGSTKTGTILHWLER